MAEWGYAGKVVIMGEENSGLDMVDPKSDFDDILGDVETNEISDDELDDELGEIEDGDISLDEL